MDTDERLMALKKAYADIILNTEKEAAQRIMVSERKAVRLEYELKVAKEDAVQMLMRVKQMMDCKISKAAVASCTREKKIEELEAQLQEAEDIVKDLREELRTVEAEVGRFSKIKDVKHMVQVANAPTREPVTYPPLEVQLNSYIDQANKNQRFFSSLLPSIISRSKETELFRNGCTQRIRACERTTPDNKDIKANLTSTEDEVPEKELMLEEIKEIDLATDNSCLTSLESVKHTNAITMDENMVRVCNSQSTSGEEVMPVRQEKEEVDPPLMITESKVCATDEVLSQPLRNRVIKYTFQRKRKRGTLIDGSGFSERGHENQTANVGSVKGNFIGESTPEKIRLEQVARQLISLSDNKCW